MDTPSLPSSGRIERASLPPVVRDLWRARASGSLHLTNGSATKRIVFKSGDIVFAATNVEQERLGERLIRAGKVKRSVVDLACRVIERSHERFGKTLVEMGWVTPAEMKESVAAQIKDIVRSVFTWESGSFRFEPSDDPVPPDLLLELQTAELVYEGARRISDLKAIRAGVGSPSSRLRLVDGRHLAIPVTRDDGFILARVDGRTSIRDIVSSSPLGQEDSLRRVYALMLAGVLERDTTKPDRNEEGETGEDAKDLPSDEEKRFRDGVVARYAAMRFGNLYDRLGVDFGASEETIREAYAEVLASLRPDPSFEANLDDLERRLVDVSRKVAEAFETLVDPMKRRAYDRSLNGYSPESTIASQGFSSETIAPGTPTREEDPAGKAQREAELYYLEGTRLAEDGEYFDAIASLSEAVRLHPRKGSYHRHLAKLLAQNPSCLEAAQEHFERAIELDDTDEEAYNELARLYQEEGLTGKAQQIKVKLATRG
jgi:curved DNA-binding protein CbpA